MAFDILWLVFNPPPSVAGDNKKAQNVCWCEAVQIERTSVQMGIEDIFQWADKNSFLIYIPKENFMNTWFQSWLSSLSLRQYITVRRALPWPPNKHFYK